MPLGIKPTVDFAFKKISASPKNKQALIGLLNAILNRDSPIVAVTIVDPFSYQEFAKQKLIGLDIRARDTDGNWFNVEMQVTVNAGLIQRIVYYACRLYADQLQAGQDYVDLHPVVTICLLSKNLFGKQGQRHCHFALSDAESGRRLDNAVEVHTLELLKYNVQQGEIHGASKIEQWVFFLLHAHEYSAEELRVKLPDEEFQPAINELEVISKKTKDRIMYDQREKAQRDYEWALKGAKTEGREEGREEGRLAGKIQVLQELLGEQVSTDEALLNRPMGELNAVVSQLQNRLRIRD